MQAYPTTLTQPQPFTVSHRGSLPCPGFLTPRPPGSPRTQTLMGATWAFRPPTDPGAVAPTSTLNVLLNNMRLDSEKLSPQDATSTHSACRGGTRALQGSRALPREVPCCTLLKAPYGHASLRQQLQHKLLNPFLFRQHPQGHRRRGHGQVLHSRSTPLHDWRLPL